MIFKRKVYDRLLKWKELSAGTSAVLLEGARRIGKTTIVEEFAKNEYDDYMILDDFDTKDNPIIVLKSRFTSFMVESKNGISILVIFSFPFIFGFKDVPFKIRSDVNTPCFINGFLKIMLNIFASVGV